jgi:hypothetical protein
MSDHTSQPITIDAANIRPALYPRWFDDPGLTFARLRLRNAYDVIDRLTRDPVALLVPSEELEVARAEASRAELDLALWVTALDAPARRSRRRRRRHLDA